MKLETKRLTPAHANRCGKQVISLQIMFSQLTVVTMQ